MALPPLQQNWGLFYFNSKLNFRHPPRCNKVDFWPIHCAALVDISAARTHNEWVNIDEQQDEPGPFFPVTAGVEVVKRGEAPSGPPPGIEEPLSIFRTFPVKFRKRYQSHFKAVGLHLFVRDAERCSDDSADSSNPTYSKSSHKHIQTMHSRASATSLTLCVPVVTVSGGGVSTQRSWLRKQLQLQSVLDKWVCSFFVTFFAGKAAQTEEERFGVVVKNNFKWLESWDFVLLIRGR